MDRLKALALGPLIDGKEKKDSRNLQNGPNKNENNRMFIIFFLFGGGKKSAGQVI